MDLSGELRRRLGTPRKCDRLVVSPSWKEGCFDSHTVDCPFVFSIGDEYRMTFVGWDGIGYRTGWARSKDLQTWTKEGLLIDRGPRGSYTEYNVALTSLIRDNNLRGKGQARKIDGRYVGTYHCYPSPGLEQGPGAIGLCFSKDLLHWTLDDPILHAGEGASWEKGGLYKSWIMEYDSTFYIFYNAKNMTEGGWKEQTGMVHSPDLLNWKRYEGNPILRNGGPGTFDERFASDPCVLKDDDVWICSYFGLSTDGHAREGFALSRDLLNWRQDHLPYLDVGPAGSIDSLYAHKPALIHSGSALYHFYCAVSRCNEPKIGEIKHSEYRGISYAIWS